MEIGVLVEPFVIVVAGHRAARCGRARLFGGGELSVGQAEGFRDDLNGSSGWGVTQPHVRQGARTVSG